jgi:hypothetical protein
MAGTGSAVAVALKTGEEAAAGTAVAGALEAAGWEGAAAALFDWAAAGKAPKPRTAKIRGSEGVKWCMALVNLWKLGAFNGSLQQQAF